ncbi:unnamed protein product [Spirodela intermedia]|uniref:Uncharacterized protein n=1 Tax=Spirodela intermedia TaxID=51605 RepID=A0A7I8J2U2_SPIIN|nr:unnamed protein product [Spirodela intermedia]CAA6664546.1 unnamed protein product [Spirodela intermedia]CAA6674057.1 unnamed protein product [Spirodela intermedia]CAA6674404.1 unnamed protein product [Spirodela intermedia]
MAGCHMRFPQNVFGERFLKCSQEELQEKLPSMVSVQMGWSSVKLISVMVMAGNKSDGWVIVDRPVVDLSWPANDIPT